MSSFRSLKIKRLVPGLYLPEKGTEGSAGFDIFCPVNTIVPGHNIVVIPLGFKAKIPQGKPSLKHH